MRSEMRAAIKRHLRSTRTLRGHPDERRNRVRVMRGYEGYEGYEGHEGYGGYRRARGKAALVRRDEGEVDVGLTGGGGTGMGRAGRGRGEGGARAGEGKTCSRLPFRFRRGVQSEQNVMPFFKHTRTHTGCTRRHTCVRVWPSSRPPGESM
jgi:hypothetical protein